MPDNQPFVATIRLVINAETEVDARIIADRVAEDASELLDPEEGDQVAVSEVIPFTLQITPHELVDRLYQTRNSLIRTKIKQCYDAARDLDFIAHHLRGKIDPDYAHTDYDYSRMLELTERILNHNESPTD